MATLDLTQDSTTYPQYGNQGGSPTLRAPMHGTFTFTTRPLRLKELVTTNDVLEVFDIPLGCSILGGYLTVDEAPNESVDVVIGTTGVDANGFLESTTIASTVAAGKTYAFAGTLVGGVNLTADSADITFSNVAAPLTSGIFRVTFTLAGNPTGAISN